MTLLNFFKKKKQKSISEGFSFITPKIKKYIDKTGGQKSQTYDLSKKEDELNMYKDTGILKVEISAKDCCKKCKEYDKKIFLITEVFTKNILPNKECLDENCVCTYLPVFE